jgi:hypothetical protein
MKIDKTKNYNIFSISRIKTHLNISEDDYTYDDIIRWKLFSAVDHCENVLKSSIVPTNCVLESDTYLTPFTFIYYRIPDVNVTISAITVSDYNGNVTTVQPSQYRIENYSNFTQLYFNPSISGYALKIYYSAGNQSLATIPYAVQEAINVMTAMLFDGDRQGLLPINVNQTNLVERLLSPYVNL